MIKGPCIVGENFNMLIALNDPLGKLLLEFSLLNNFVQSVKEERTNQRKWNIQKFQGVLNYKNPFLVKAI